MVASKVSAMSQTGDPGYPDHCRQCRRAGRIMWSSREWIHYPATVAPAEPGTVVAYYRCRQCQAEWTCGWADGGIDRTPSGKRPLAFGAVMGPTAAPADRRTGMPSHRP